MCKPVSPFDILSSYHFSYFFHFISRYAFLDIIIVFDPDALLARQTSTFDEVIKSFESLALTLARIE